MSRFRWRRGRSHPAGPDASYFLRPPALALPYVGFWSGGSHASSHSLGTMQRLSRILGAAADEAPAYACEGRGFCASCAY